MQTSHISGERRSHGAGRLSRNHTDPPQVRSEVRAGAIMGQHSEALVVRSEVRAGGLTRNHSQALVVRSEGLAVAGGTRA